LVLALNRLVEELHQASTQDVVVVAAHHVPRAAARAIRIPTLLIRGAQSDVVSPEGARELLELIPGSRYIDVGGAGHMVGGDDNDVLSRGLVEFLDEAVLTA
jgi:pimeloyl-ACP methyl ester carboxylesterase